MKNYDLVKTIILEKALENNSFKASLEAELMQKLNKINNFSYENIMKKIILISLAVLLLVGSIYLGVKFLNNKEDDSNKKEDIITDTEDENTDNTGIANPASTYCVENGGTLKMVDETDGQVGYCHFDDGSKCEEWAFFRGECMKGDNK